MISIANVHKTFGNLAVLRGIDLEIGANDIVALVGENGAGKSTLLQIVSGITRADEGRISIGGHALDRERVHALRALGFAPENADLPTHLRAREWISLVSAIKRAAIENDFDTDRFSSTMLGDLSLGQRRRLLLACAWMGAPKAIVLDEPTNGLDDDARRVLVRAIEARTSAILIATHDLAFAHDIGAHIVRIEKGRVIS